MQGVVDSIFKLKNTQIKAKERGTALSQWDVTVEEFTKMIDKFMDNGMPAGVLTVLYTTVQYELPFELRVTLPEPLSL